VLSWRDVIHRKSAETISEACSDDESMNEIISFQ
jgi:hypothetical protein